MRSVFAVKTVLLLLVESLIQNCSGSTVPGSSSAGVMASVELLHSQFDQAQSFAEALVVAAECVGIEPFVGRHLVGEDLHRDDRQKRGQRFGQVGQLENRSLWRGG